jgi:hypothetical protein
MNVINSDEFKASMVDLTQRWMLGLIDADGFAKLNDWYSALAGEPLGRPDGMTVEKVEYWLYKLTFVPFPKPDRETLDALWKSMEKPD